jgi:hypothetical protein
MPNKLNAYIDPAKLQGAFRMKLKSKTGEAEDCLVIVLSKSRIRVNERNPERLGLALDFVPNKDGKDEYGNTHWCKESVSKAEREAPNPPQLQFLGNAREYEPGGQRSARPASAESRESAQVMTEGLEDDDIPF